MTYINTGEFLHTFLEIILFVYYSNYLTKQYYFEHKNAILFKSNKQTNKTFTGLLNYLTK